MSYCIECEQNLTPEQLKKRHEAALIENAKKDGNTWAKENNYTGLLYVVEFVNGFKSKRKEQADASGRPIIETYFVPR